jgi:hypothetical protein
MPPSTGTLLCDSNLAALTNNSKSSGDATIVVSDNTDPAFIRPSGVGTSIKLDVTAAGTGFTIWNLDWTINTSLVNIGRFGFAYYFSPSVLTNWGLTVMLSEASNFANRYNYSPFTVAPNAARQGWNTVVLDRATPSSTTGSPNIANTFTRVRVQLQVPAGVTGTVYLCPIYTNMYNRPKIVFSYDDQDASQYTNGYQVLDTYGLAWIAMHPDEFHRRPHRSTIPRNERGWVEFPQSQSGAYQSYNGERCSRKRGNASRTSVAR